MKTFIIAEIGVNHNGDINKAKELVTMAAKCGVDAVKFQTFKAENIVSVSAPKANYQIVNTNNNESQLEMLKKLTLTYDEFVDIKNHCNKCNVLFLSSAFDLESVDMLISLQMPLWKIPSGEITNLPYLVKIAKTKLPILLSTGMSTLEEIRQAIKLLKDNGAMDITLLQCNTEYPTPFVDVNLKVIESLRNEFNLPVGFSDHTLGIEVPIAAVALGATVIEKHITMDKTEQGPDHRASLEPEELKNMVCAIRNIEKAIGTDEKTVSPSESKNREIARKSIVARVNIKKGEIFTKDNLTTKRPGKGISPMLWNDVIGKKAKYDFSYDEEIKL